MKQTEALQLSGLGTEKRNPVTMELDEMTPLEIVSVMNQEDQSVVRAVEAVLPQVAEIIARATDSLRRGGRIIYIGAGTSGRLGVLDAVECPPTFGVTDQTVIGLIAGGERAFVKAKEGAEDDEEQGETDLQTIGLETRDIVIGLTASGRTPYVMGALLYARKMGCATAAISCNLNAEVSKAADIAVEVNTGAEVLSGSTRLKAGTAEKMILNMISTASMVGIGKAYQNLMVDVRQTNEKLVCRAQNIVMQGTGCTRECAVEALREANGEAKLAITKLLLSVDVKTAKQFLDQADGMVRQAIRNYACVKENQPSLQK